MSKPLFAMTLHELVMLGKYDVVALERTEETKGLIAEFAKVLDVLEGASGPNRRAQQDLSVAGIPVQFAEYETRAAIRRVVSLACGPDGGQTPLYQALFPRESRRSAGETGPATCGPRTSRARRRSTSTSATRTPT